jgi:hypothetical protein
VIHDLARADERVVRAWTHVTVEQARVNNRHVSTVRAEAGAEAADKAARLLIDWAGRFEPGILRGLGARILTHVAPGVANEAGR